MLKQIAISDLRVGMFVSRLDASWTQHPFWKSAFLIEDSATLRKLQGSGVATCWIDIAQGEDLAAPIETLN